MRLKKLRIQRDGFAVSLFGGGHCAQLRLYNRVVKPQLCGLRVELQGCFIGLCRLRVLLGLIQRQRQQVMQYKLSRVLRR